MVTFMVMEATMSRTMAAGEFKAKCLEVMDEVASTGKAIVLTKRGKPVAQLVPIARRPETLRGFLKGRIRSGKDVVRPVRVTWHAARR